MSKNNGQGTMNIGGKDRPFHVNSARQTDKFTEHLGIELDEYWEKMSQLSNGKTLTNKKIMVVFLWSALYAGAILEYRKCDFTYDDVLDWFEAADDDEAEELVKPMTLLSDMLAETKKKLDEEAALLKKA